MISGDDSPSLRMVINLLCPQDDHRLGATMAATPNWGWASAIGTEPQCLGWVQEWFGAPWDNRNGYGCSPMAQVWSTYANYVRSCLEERWSSGAALFHAVSVVGSTQHEHHSGPVRRGLQLNSFCKIGWAIQKKLGELNDGFKIGLRMQFLAQA